MEPVIPPMSHTCHGDFRDERHQNMTRWLEILSVVVIGVQRATSAMLTAWPRNCGWGTPPGTASLVPHLLALDTEPLIWHALSHGSRCGGQWARVFV